VLTTVPDVAGLPFDQAKQQLESAGFVVNDGGYVASGYATDTVAYTSPGGGGQIASGTTITVYRSNGTPAPVHTGGGGGNNHGNGHGNGNPGHGH
jgi:beta-lactam-binding protein with PASTA domain